MTRWPPSSAPSPACRTTARTRSRWSPIREGRHVLEVLLAMQTSARTGEPVCL